MKWIHYLALFISFSLIGCGKAKETNKASEEKVAEAASVPLHLEGEADPIADSGAKSGGEFTTWAGPFPKSLNMWLDYNAFSVEIIGLLYEPLVTLHSTKNVPTGVLAKSWEISDDQMTFTFHIHPNAKWSDGKDITASDVLFFYDTMMNPKHLTSLFRVDLKRFERPEVVDAKTVRIKAKDRHWKNYWSAAGFYALPKHAYEKKNFNKINFDFPVVSGPYQLQSVKKGRYIRLKRRADWWGRIKKYNSNKYNFDFIRYRALTDRVKTLELFKKGKLDMYPIYTAKIWAKQTQFDAVQKGWVVRQRVHNREPLGFQGISMNMRKEIFQNKKVRMAMAHLMNRELMNEKLMFNQYFMLNSYYPDLYPNQRNPTMPVTKYDPDKARQLLKEAGWKVNDEGHLVKDGKKFEITFLTYSVDLRHLNTYIVDLKAVGMLPKIETLSPSSLRKRLDQHDFDLYWQAWGASRLRDPEAMWHSSEAKEISSSNRSGVQDSEIDALIEKQRNMMSLDERNTILKKIDRKLVEMVPYVLLWQSGSHRLLYWNKFGRPKYVLDKFNREDVAVVYWWYDEAKAKKLEEAKSKGLSLGREPENVIYQE